MSQSKGSLINAKERAKKYKSRTGSRSDIYLAIEMAAKTIK